MILKNFIAHGIDFDWIGGDGLYGHTYEFARGLDERNLSFVLDVHKNQQIYLQAPNIYVPEQKSSKGRKPTRLKADCPGKRVDKYVEGLPDEAW
jgi:SRSO17 transposase